jgi:3-hydroxyacyl-[acyl-carrier-protein] dehydratase
MRWMWIDSIVEYEPARRLVAIKAVSRGEEQLRHHLGPGHEELAVMPATLLIEGMAQTAGILVGAANAFKEKVALAKILSARFDEDVFPGQTVRYEATLARIDRAGAMTSGAVARLVHPQTAWQPIGQVELMFSHLDRNQSGLQFPEENFVFSENFACLLREAGLAGLG